MNKTMTVLLASRNNWMIASRPHTEEKKKRKQQQEDKSKNKTKKKKWTFRQIL